MCNGVAEIHAVHQLQTESHSTVGKEASVIKWASDTLKRYLIWTDLPQRMIIKFFSG